MRLISLVLFGLSLLPIPAAAICTVDEPLEDQLRSADVVYVGTVVESKLVSSLKMMRAARYPHGKLGSVQNTLVPELIFKGDPSRVPVVTSSTLSSDPKGPFMRFGELVPVSPGDVLLVVARTGETPSIDLCSASRHWELETSRLVTKVLGPAP